MVFRNSVEPAFCVTFEADITKFKHTVKEKGVSFTLAMVYSVCKCANEIEAFRYRFLDGKVVLFDKIDTAFTYLNKDTELFKVVNVPMMDDLREYCELASKTANEQKEYFTGPLGNDVFQCSPMPWVTYTHISHTNSGVILTAMYCLIWIILFKKNSIFRALALSIIPSCIFIISGILSHYWPLMIASVIFAPCHIAISYKNAALEVKG